MTASGRVVEWDRLRTWNRGWALAIVFGLASVPWTYGFVAGLTIPLWPAFLGSATVFAAGSGLEGLLKGAASNVAGIAYAAATLALAQAIAGPEVLVLSVLVGLFMLVASLHAFVPLLSFTPGGFVGFATLFSVHAAEPTAFGVGGLPGATLAAVLAMLVGAAIGLAADAASGTLAG